MPLPRPKRNEKQGDFVSRCISAETKASPGRDPKQIQAMCFQAWRDRNKEAASIPIPNLTETELKEGFRYFPCEISFAEATIEQSADHPIIRNITVLGSESKNKRKYLRTAMQEATPLYDNVKVFANHQKEESGGIFNTGGGPDVMKLAGKLSDPVFDSNGLKIRADFHGLPNDPISEKITNIARNMPEIAGFSHNAKGKMKVEDGVEIVESIEQVFSVDLVAYPATNRGMFEHNKGESEMDYTKITLEELRKLRPDIVEQLEADGKCSRDEEVNELIKERDEAKAKIDEYEVAQALSEKEKLIEKMLGESDLPKEAKTDVFRKTLKGLSPKDSEKLEDLVKEQIDDRMLAVGKKVVTNNTEKHTTNASESEKTDEEIIASLQED